MCRPITATRDADRGEAGEELTGCLTRFIIDEMLASLVLSLKSDAFPHFLCPPRVLRCCCISMP